MYIQFKKYFFYSLLFIGTASASQKNPPSQTPSPFSAGEVLEYRVHYGLINAGNARIEISKDIKQVRDKQVYHAIGTGRSNSFFDSFFKVRDYYSSYIDVNTFNPLQFIRRVDEGGYKIKQDYQFYPEENTVEPEKGKKEKLAFKNVQDMISAFYYSRTIDYSKAKIGDVFSIPTYLDGEIFQMKMKYMGTDTIKVDKGKFSCIKFAPVVQKGRIFKKEEDLMVWVSNDKNKIPVLAQAKIMVGSIRMDLTKYEGLSHPLALIKK